MGDQTPGVQRQYLGCVGTVDNGIETVHVGVAKGTFQAILDADLFLPTVAPSFGRATRATMWVADQEHTLVVAINEGIQEVKYFLTNATTAALARVLGGVFRRWTVEEYHRGLKQVTNVERCPRRKAVAQRDHIGMALRAFLFVEWWCFRTGVNWLSAKWQIVRKFIRLYCDCPIYRPTKHATA